MDEAEKIEITMPKLVIGLVIVAVMIAGGLFTYQKYYLPKAVKNIITDMNPNPNKTPVVTEKDHILGSITAPVKVVVYTDFECPYCKVFHNSILDLSKDYIAQNKVAFIYRSFPLDQLHSQARGEAQASECAAKLGGNDKYWQYVNKIMESTHSNNSLDMSLLPKFATDLGLNEKDFTACLADKTVADKINEVQAAGQDAGAQGTPYPIVFYKDVVKGPLQGALPADQLRKMVDSLLEASK
jgi:protein-disulfide isomerase